MLTYSYSFHSHSLVVLLLILEGRRTTFIGSLCILSCWEMSSFSIIFTQVLPISRCAYVVDGGDSVWTRLGWFGTDVRIQILYLIFLQSVPLCLLVGIESVRLSFIWFASWMWFNTLDRWQFMGRSDWNVDVSQCPRSLQLLLQTFCVVLGNLLTFWSFHFNANFRSSEFFHYICCWVLNEDWLHLDCWARGLNLHAVYEL